MERLVSILLILAFGAYRARDLDALSGSGAVDGQVMFVGAIWLVLGSIAAGYLLRSKLDIRLFRRGPLLWYFVFNLVCAVTSFTSTNVFIGLFYSLQMTVLVVIACCLFSSKRSLVEFTLIYVAVNWCCFLLGETGVSFGIPWITTAKEMYLRYGGNEGESFRMATAFGHPSQLSIVAALGAVAVLGSVQRGNLWRTLPAFLLLSATVLMAVSRTAILGFSAGIFTVFIYQRRVFSIGGFVLISLPYIGLFWPGLLDVGNSFFMRGQSSTELDTLNGRSDIYEVALQRWSGTVLGDGFRSLREVPILGPGWGHGVAHAHNALLTALIESGYVGGAVVLLVIITLVWHSLWLFGRTFHRQVERLSNCTVEPLAMCFPAVAFCMLDSGFAVEANPFVACFVMQLSMVRRAVLIEGATHVETESVPFSLNKTDEGMRCP